MEKTRLIVTISGNDKVGIVAAFAKVLAEMNVNIEDIRQSVMKDNFVMFLMGDISKCQKSFQEIKNALITQGEELGMEVWVQRKQIFDKMHTI
ncbi:MAG: ACT domain-containing protein [Candidatus Gastranaerophilales bacterium]|nr:ACT domain-containing protein [Candidatus Gastranaerophilales bacterium]